MGSIPIARSILGAHIAQSVEHFLGKEEVTGSIPVVGFKMGSNFLMKRYLNFFRGGFLDE